MKKWNSLKQAERDFLSKLSAEYEKNSDKIVAKNLAADEVKLAKAGVKIINLKGEYAKAYLKTIYDAKWKINDKYKYTVDYKKLKPLMYE